MPRSHWLPQLCRRHGWRESGPVSVRVLRAEAVWHVADMCDVWHPRHQGCCGAEQRGSGESPEKQSGARKDPAMPSLVAAPVWSGCGGGAAASAGRARLGARSCPSPSQPARLAAALGPALAPAPISACLQQRRRTPRTLKRVGHARRMSPPSRKSSSCWALGGPLATTLMKFGLISS